MNNHIVKNILGIVIVLIWLVSCADEPCNEDMRSNIKIGFYKLDSVGNAVEPVEYRIDSLFIEQDTLLNVKSISMFLNTGTTETELTLSLDSIQYIYDSIDVKGFDTIPIKDTVITDTINIDGKDSIITTHLQDTFLLETVVVGKKWAIIDTNRFRVSDDVTFTYKVTHEFVSHECGYRFYFDSLETNSTTKNYLKEIRENTEPSTTNEVEETFKFIFD